MLRVRCMVCEAERSQAPLFENPGSRCEPFATSFAHSSIGKGKGMSLRLGASQ